jgi:hypothetical protein
MLWTPLESRHQQVVTVEKPTILLVVEGYGEVRAVPRLFRRLLHEKFQVYSLEGKPFRCTKDSMTADPNEFKNVFEIPRSDPGVMAVLFLFDADKDCARDHVPAMRQWAEEAGQDIPCEIVMIRQEFESWFLAAVDSLRGKKGILETASFPGDSEANRDAKKILSRFYDPASRLFPTYSEQRDQEALVEVLDLDLAYRNAPTFRRFVHALCRLLTALGEEPSLPEEWKEEAESQP